MTEEHIRYDLQPPARFSTWVGVVLLFVIFGFFVLVVIGAMPRGSDYESKRARIRLEKLAEVHKEADKALGSYGWVNKEKGVVHIPIERAMQAASAELAVEKPTVAGPIATPAPAEPAPAASATPSAKTAAPATPVPGGSPDMRTNPTPEPVSVEGPKSENRNQPAGASNPPAVAPGTQPGPSATPAASPPPRPARPNPGNKPVTTPVQHPAGTPIPPAGLTPTPTP